MKDSEFDITERVNPEGLTDVTAEINARVRAFMDEQVQAGRCQSVILDLPKYMGCNAAGSEFVPGSPLMCDEHRDKFLAQKNRETRKCSRCQQEWSLAVMTRLMVTKQIICFRCLVMLMFVVAECCDCKGKAPSAMILMNDGGRVVPVTICVNCLRDRPFEELAVDFTNGGQVLAESSDTVEEPIIELADQ